MRTKSTGAFSAQVRATKPIYTGGRISAGIRQAKAGISAADAQYEAARHSERAAMEAIRSEERRVGEEGRSRWSPDH